MPEDKSNNICFIIMPISTPRAYLDVYNGDPEHFRHVLEHLFKPAVEDAGFKPISPIATGSDLIQAEIIKHLSEADLVLCDMSTLNANVFYEFGIRSALDKPVALVVDDKTERVPFDTAIINHHRYSSAMNVWEQSSELSTLTSHIQTVYNKCDGRNSLWKYFGVSQVGEFKPGESTAEEKVDLLLREVSQLRQSIRIAESDIRRDSVPLPLPGETTWFELPSLHPILQPPKYIQYKGYTVSDKDVLERIFELLNGNNESQKNDGGS